MAWEMPKFMDQYGLKRENMRMISYTMNPGHSRLSCRFLSHAILFKRTSYLPLNFAGMPGGGRVGVASHHLSISPALRHTLLGPGAILVFIKNMLSAVHPVDFYLP